MDQATTTDEILVERIRAGEYSLYGILADRHRQSVCRVVGRMLRGDSEVEDVVQETHLKAFSRLHQLQNEACFSTWLRRIAVNQSLQYLRSACRLQYVGGEDAPAYSNACNAAGSWSLDPEHQASAKEVRDALNRALETLNSQLRPVFVMKEIDGFTTREIGSRLGISEVAVRTRLHRAKNKLRRSLQQTVSKPAKPDVWGKPSPSIAALLMEVA